jgi:hypothetical protein
MTILDSHRFHLPVRRFVLDLFDRKVMRQIVLEEEDDSDWSDNEDIEPPPTAIKNGLQVLRGREDSDDEEDTDTDGMGQTDGSRSRGSTF